MRSTRWLAGASAGLLLYSVSAMAGPNEGGTLLLHANSSLVYTTETSSYCGQSGLEGCWQVDDSVPADSTTTTVFFAVAAFPDTASPRLAGVTFGVDYDEDDLVVVAHGSCGDFELATEGWPAPGSGTSVTWNEAQTGTLTDVYWFAAYAYSSSRATTFALASHPTQSAVFASDAVPAELDAVVALGTLGFGTPGYAPCPVSSEQSGASGAGTEPNGQDGEDPPAPGQHIYTIRVKDTKSGDAVAGVQFTLTERVTWTRFCNAGSTCSGTPSDQGTRYHTATVTTNAGGYASYTFEVQGCHYLGEDNCWELEQHAGFDPPVLVENPSSGVYSEWVVARVISGDNATHGIYVTSESYLAEVFAPVLHRHGTLELQNGLGDVDETIASHSTLNAFNVQGQNFGPWHPVGDLHKVQPESPRTWDSYAYGGIFTAWVLDIADAYRHEDGGDLRPLYYHVYPYADGAVVQYWYFFNCNDTSQQWGLGFHEGDWEHVSIYVTWQSGGWKPQSVDFYQHQGGEVQPASNCWWSATRAPTYELLQQGADAQHLHLHVWLAANSHASYNRYAYRYGLITDPPGGSCDFEIWDYVDYNIANQAAGGHTFFEYDELVDLGEYWTVGTAHGDDWAAHIEGPLPLNRFVGHYGENHTDCPSGCPSIICDILKGTGLTNPYAVAPTAPLNEPTVHNWRSYHPYPDEQRWGNEPPQFASMIFADYPLRNNYLGRFLMCGDGSREHISFDVPARYNESGKLRITVQSGDLAFSGLTSCGTGCYEKSLTYSNGAYHVSLTAATGTGTASLTVYGVSHSGNPDAEAMTVDIKESCGTAGVEPGRSRAMVQEFDVIPRVVTGGPVHVEFEMPGRSGDRVTVHDAMGRKVFESVCRGGELTVDWSGKSGHGEKLPSGLYFVSLERAGMPLTTRRLVVVK